MERQGDFGTPATPLWLARAIALADIMIWATNRAHEAGEHYRAFVDAIVGGIGPKCGAPYVGGEYVCVLPAHWLAEPSQP